MARMTSVQPPAKRVKMGPRLPGFTSPGQTASGPDVNDGYRQGSIWDASSSKKEQIRDLTYSCKTKQDFLQNVLVKVLVTQLRTSLNHVSKLSIDTTCSISVIGESGSGKSSLYSGMSGYPRILPTGNSGDAVTAVPVTLCPAPDMRCNFAAKVKYLDAAEWRAVLEAALLTIADGNDKEVSDSGPVAQAKAVYNVADNEDLPSRSVEELLDHKAVKDFLGKDDTIEEDDLDSFRNQLRGCVAASTKDGINAVWPLVTEATVLLKRPNPSFFAMGQEPIDVPGTGDENPARAERYHRYLRTSRVLLICTDTGRANSKKEYRGLIKRAIRKFQYDGRLDRIVLVCTKFDQANMEEIREEMGDVELDVQLGEKQLAEAKLKQTDQEVQQARLALQTKGTELETLKKALKSWRAKTTSLRKGFAKHPVKPPTTSANDAYLDLSRIAAPLDLPAAEYAVRTLEHAKKQLEEECNTLQASTPRLEALLQKQSTELRDLDLEYNRANIGSRIRHIKKRQTDIFLSLVKKSQMNRRDAEEAVRGPDDVREDEEYYQKVRENLKVFCTSTYAYQDLSGLNSEGLDQHLILNIEDSGVPALMRHLEEVAMSVRLDHLKALDNKLNIAYASLKIWSMQNPDSLLKQLNAAKDKISEFQIDLRNFLGKVKGFFMVALTAVRKSHKQQLSQLRATISKQAVTKVIERLDGYGKPPKSGLFAQELKAVCKNGGVWDGKRELGVNLNKMVAEKARLGVDRGTKALFVTDHSPSNDVKSVKMALQQCDGDICDVLGDLHLKFHALATLLGVDGSTIDRLEEQLKSRKSDVHYIIGVSKQNMEDILIDAFDAMVGDVHGRFLKAYEQGSRMGGSGVKAEIIAELSKALTRDGVILYALRRLEERLIERAAAEIDGLDQQVNDIAVNMKAEYESAIHQRNAELDDQEKKQHQLAMQTVRNDLVQHENPKFDSGDGDSGEGSNEAVDQQDEGGGRQIPVC